MFLGTCHKRQANYMSAFPCLVAIPVFKPSYQMYSAFAIIIFRLYLNLTRLAADTSAF